MTLVTVLTVLASRAPAIAQVITITQAKALAGNVTPGDAPGLPITISRPGKYLLRSNLELPNADTNGIEIRENEVTIDLNGFRIIGPNLCTGCPVTSCSNFGTGVGIVSFPPQGVNCEVRNGTVTLAANDGIRLGEFARVEDVRVLSSGAHGIHVGGSSEVRNCTLRANSLPLGDPDAPAGWPAIETGVDSIATGNIVTCSGLDGISVGVGSLVADNVININGSCGVRVGEGSGVKGNTIKHNARCGLFAGDRAGYSQNVFFGNAPNVQGSGVDLGHNAFGP